MVYFAKFIKQKTLDLPNFLIEANQNKVFTVPLIEFIQVNINIIHIWFC